MSMNPNDIAKQLERANFPAGVQVSTYREEGRHHEGHNDLAGTVFRVQQQDTAYGFELLLTDKAAHKYGAGPALLLTIEQLQKHIAAGLPALNDEEYQRLTFVGD